MVYQDSSGSSALQIAEDSALRFVEVLQCMGYEVRPLKNVTCTYAYMNVYDTCVYIYIYIYTYIDIEMYTYICIHIYMYICVNAYIFICIYIHICTYIYM